MQANVGPQLVSAYVDTVLVRPGATVKRGEVLATLDCREASASTKAIAARARALDARQQAIAHEATRTQGLLDGGFVSPNEAEQKTAQSTSEAAQVESERANLARSSLEVNDCILRAPFNGEVAQRSIDPGAFVRPGNTIVTVVDRSTVRMTADAPEMDFDVVPAGTKVAVHVYATNRNLPGDHHPSLAGRRSGDPHRALRDRHRGSRPVRSRWARRARSTSRSGRRSPATEIPLYAATVRGSKANVFVVDHDVAHSQTVARRGRSAEARSSSTPRSLPGRWSWPRGARSWKTAIAVEAKETAAATSDASRVGRWRERSHDVTLAAEPHRRAHDVHRAGGLRRGGHAADERRHLPRADAAGARRRNAGARASGPRTSRRRSAGGSRSTSAPPPASITSRASRATTSASSTSG